VRVFCAFLLAVVVASAENPIDRLQAKIDSGQVRLNYDGPRGYLDSLLEALEVLPETQTLVFSKTSAQFRLINPRSPRALYFNDEVYIGYVRGGPFLEISTADPETGAAFYTLPQDGSKPARFVADNGQCLQCHETARTLRVPGHLTRSVHPLADGQPVFRLGSIDVSQKTPFAERFGGWYVDAIAGAAKGGAHRGNQVLLDEEGENRGPAPGYDPSAYPAPGSDPVAHLLLIHQTQTHNRIARAALEARRALKYREEMTIAFGEASPELDASVKRRIEGPAEQLVQALLFEGEAPLPEGLPKDSPLIARYAARGPLYELDLERGLLKNRISYLVESEEFRTLPDEVLKYVFRRFREIAAEDPERKDLLHKIANRPR